MLCCSYGINNNNTSRVQYRPVVGRERKTKNTLECSGETFTRVCRTTATVYSGTSERIIIDVYTRKNIADVDEATGVRRRVR